MTDQPYRRPDQRPDAQWSGAHPGGPQQPYAQQPFVQQGSPYGYPGYYGIPAEPKSLSIASMVCGIASVIMGWLLLPQFAAIITGLVLGYLCLLGYGALWLLLIIGLAVSTSYSGGTF